MDKGSHNGKVVLVRPSVKKSKEARAGFDSRPGQNIHQKKMTTRETFIPSKPSAFTLHS